ncbi:MAG: class I SAM-dependent methyltransferase [Candidatus Aminicenantes bacterium]|nr:class I SAM-dependent methyltransferase [Candidatus Aminicenantes bacterium]
MRKLGHYFGSPEDKALWENLRPYLEEEHPCIICESNKFESWAKEVYLEAKRCLKCGMISVNPHLSIEGLNKLYSEYFAYRQDDIVKKQQRDITYLIDRDWVCLFIREGKVLDVGCSGGFFLSKFSPENWNRFGVEIASDAAEYAMSNFGIPVRVGDIVELDFVERFDLVMLRGVIEHFRDPISVLEKCCKLLKPGGYLFITATPAGASFAFEVYREKWGLFTPLEHIHFFSVKLLSRILNAYEMSLISHHYQYEETPYANPPQDYKKIQQDIVLVMQGDRDKIAGSVPFPGSMITALWEKTP